MQSCRSMPPARLAGDRDRWDDPDSFASMSSALAFRYLYFVFMKIPVLVVVSPPFILPTLPFAQNERKKKEKDVNWSKFEHQTPTFVFCDFKANEVN